MKISDVARFFSENIVRHTNYFSNEISGVSGVSVSGTNITVTTSSPHGLASGDLISVPSVSLENDITAVASSGQNIRFTTAADNDLTLSYHSTVELQGFTVSAWNGISNLRSVPNRRNFDISGEGKPPTLPMLNGNEVLKEKIEVGIFGPNLVQVSAATLNTLTFPASIDLTGRTINIQSIVKNVRVSACVNIERVLESYTKQAPDKFWAFICPENVVISKDRRAGTDAVSERGHGTSMIETLLDNFSLYIIAPCRDEISGVKSLDTCRHTLLSPILKTLRGVKFSTGTSRPTQNGVIMTGHGLYAYTGAYLAYQYTFQFVSRLGDEDQNQFTGSVAFRDIDYTTTFETGLSQGPDTLNLDEEPI